MGFGELFLLAIGLSMDAFAVSICKGLSVSKANLRQGAVCGLWFGGFQALMPLIGFFLGSIFADAIMAFDHWVAFVLLALIGKDSMEKAVRRMEIPLLLRQMVTDSAVRRGIDRQREEIEQAIISALADPRNGFASRLTASLSRSLGAQLEIMAQNAEMSICA